MQEGSKLVPIYLFDTLNPNLKLKITSLLSKMLKSIKGLGKSLLTKIQEIIDTGTCPAYDKIKDYDDIIIDYLAYFQLIILYHLLCSTYYYIK